MATHKLGMATAVGSCLLALVFAGFPARAVEPATPVDPRIAIADESVPSEAHQDEEGQGADVEGEDAESEQDTLREHLTEREDKRRPPDPFSIDVAGRPLIFGGELEFEATSLHTRADRAADRRRSLQQTLQLEAEAFYSIGEPLSLFAQVQVAVEDMHGDGAAQRSERYLERGEMWLYSEDIGGSGIDLDLGRLDFEDDRRWWWDDELDAVRVAYEIDDVEFALAYARELAPNRSDRDFIAPEHDRVQRLIAEASWDWASNHTLQAFALRHDDRSRAGVPGQTVRQAREDDADAALTWLGARAMGVLDAGRAGNVGYWLDVARVRGDETRIDYEDIDATYSEVEEVVRGKVRGRAFDTGLQWLLPFAAEPRLFAGVAFGSGDRRDDDGIDHAFRQTGLQANESGFGGVHRYEHYGVALAPELSNLHVLTFGAGLSLLRSSSLDVVYHRYRLDRPAGSLRDTRLDLILDPARRDVGSAFDIVLAMEEWERFELFAAVSGFRPGRAVTGDARWRYQALFAMRLAF